MNPSSRLFTDGAGSLPVLWEDGERVFRQGRRLGDDGDRSAVPVVQPAVEHRSASSLDPLTHEYGLKDELDDAWAARPLDLVREGGRTVLVLTLLAGALIAAQPVRPSLGAESITPIPVPTELDPRRLALGQQLFRDTRLSHDNALSCSSCHDTATNGASANARDRGAAGLLHPFNTPTVFNAALNFRLTWEGNVRSLEDEAEGGLRNPATMASSAEEAVGKIRADPVMVQGFRDAYGRAPDTAALLDAIATYERSLVTPGSRFDRWLAGETSALSAEELSGYQLFKSLGCISCHQGVNVGGNLFQRHGIFRRIGTPEPELVRVPSLRNVAATAPYFHDGSVATLNEAVRLMGLAQLDRVLTDSQVDSIIAFLGTLTGLYQGRPVMPATARPSADSVPR